MIYSLRGKLIYTDASSAVIECGGVGFRCAATVNTLRSLGQTGGEVTLYTHLIVREDAMELVGFSTTQERDLFKLLTSVSGVGSKVGLAILSALTPPQLTLAVATGDAKTISRANGVGPKLANRLVLELKDKLGADFGGQVGSDDAGAAAQAVIGSNTGEATAALVALGYTQSEAALAVSKLDPALSVQELIKQALRALSRQV